MKKPIIILCLFYFSFLNGYTQKFIDPTNVWITEEKGFYVDHWGPAKSVSYKFFGDTIVNNKTYTKLYYSTRKDQSDWKLNALWREDQTGKLYQIIFDDYEILKYDFNLAVGDTMKNDNKAMDAIVDSVVIKPFGSLNRKYLYLHLINFPFHTLTWIDGIGSLFNPNIPDDFWVTGGISKLICFEENGSLVYHNPDYPDCFVTSVTRISKEKDLVELFPVENGTIQINLMKDTRGVLYLYTLNGEMVLNKSIDFPITTICVPTHGVLLFRFINNHGEVQTGKLLVK